AEVRLSNVDKHTVDGQVSVYLCNYLDVYRRSFITHEIEFMAASALPREIERFELRKGDVLVTKDSELWTDIAVPAYVPSDLDGVLCGYHLAHIRPRPGRVRGEFLFRAFQAEPIAHQFRVAASGVTRFGLSGSDVASGLFPVPPDREQATIVAFLAHFDRRINRLIRAKRRLIELLNEQKQTIMHRAVTRGLDPNVRLKASGIDWLGDVPEHWEVTRCGRLFREVVDTGHPNDELLSIDRFRGIIRQSETGRKERASEERTSYKLVHRGELAYNLMNAFMGSIGMSKLDGILSPAYAVARPRLPLDSHFFHHLLRTPLYLAQFNRYSYGIMYERNRLYFDRFSVIPALVPPLEEQRRIVGHLANGTRQLDALIAKAEGQIALLREYRTRLIADVVTGKLDVRGVELPPLDEDETVDAVDLNEDEDPVEDTLEDDGEPD
ncbi:MAG TPA: restriction endonuclease subunit S, partial [Dehalococcoidia bacterium]|nr:restriction endonuclease subunit S [Dehalococcoidia bacterium]